jgi:hypothetical protein
VLQEGSRQIKEVALVHRESASGVDDPTCICSCKRADVGVRRAKRGLHSCRKRPAEEGYGAEGVAGAASPYMGRVQSMLSSQPQCMFMQ